MAGPDGVPNEILTAVARKAPSTLMGIDNRCISDAVFPRRWKRARFVLLLKGPERPIAQPSSFRPLFIMDTAGKVLERILLHRLYEHLDRTGGLSLNQFGFRFGRSAGDAITRILDTVK